MENADVKNILNFIAKNLIHDKEVYKKVPLIVKLIKESNLIQEVVQEETIIKQVILLS